MTGEVGDRYAAASAAVGRRLRCVCSSNWLRSVLLLLSVSLPSLLPPLLSPPRGVKPFLLALLSILSSDAPDRVAAVAAPACSACLWREQERPYPASGRGSRMPATHRYCAKCEKKQQKMMAWDRKTVCFSCLTEPKKLARGTRECPGCPEILGSRAQRCHACGWTKPSDDGDRKRKTAAREEVRNCSLQACTLASPTRLTNRA